MPELLLELLTEEIPARMQARAAEDLRRLATDKLAEAGLGGRARTFVTPRRLTLVVADVAAAQPDLDDERKGPRVGAPEQAVQGFLKSVGLASLDACEQRDTGKGVFYFAVIRRAGRPAADVLPGLMREVILALPWPKSMRFPQASFRWVRPLTSVLALFDGKVLPLDLGGVPVGDTTRGHRFLAGESFTVDGFAAYRDGLARRFVMLDAAERRSRIFDRAQALAKEAGLKLKDDPALLDEVTGLVEHPVVLIGQIDAAFMDVPPEVLVSAMRAHQKYFACLDAAGRLAPRFVVVANMATRDGGKAVIAGNERVLRARLADAKFFWDQDRKATLESRVPKLAERIFHAKLGTVLDKVGRMERLVEKLAPHIAGLDIGLARRAAHLAKADLSSGMVGEFPELQGIMGRYYARHDGEDPAVAEAIAEHYAPLGPADHCPTAPVSVAVALADKIDSLVAFFAVGETPTGSKDPFALRRAALGVTRLVLENRLRLPLATIFRAAFTTLERGEDPTAALLAFFADRLKVHLREKGVRHDLIASVFALGGEDDLVRLLARVDALSGFLASEDGANLLTAYRRASNIVRIEEKKDGRPYDGAPDPKGLKAPQERRLAAALESAEKSSIPALQREDFAAAMAALADLRPPVDEFFDEVTVNCDDAALRDNRLRLLSRIRATLNRVADFSEIEG